MSARNYRPLQMHRIPYTDLTEVQVAQALRPTASGPASKSTLSSVLAGKRLKIVTDEGGPTLEYNFKTGHDLELSENGGKAVKAEVAARPALEAVKKLDQQLGLGADDPRKPEWQKSHKEPLSQLKHKVQAMKRSWPDAKSTQDAVAIADRYGVELK